MLIPRQRTGHEPLQRTPHMHTLRVSTLALAAAALALTGCTGGDAGSDGSASISGQVTDEQPFAPMANAEVRAYVVVDGELRAASDTVTTDVQGRYELTVEFSGEATSDVIVEATNDASFEARALVSGTIEDGGSY